jgi:hypothetical protein
MQYDAKTETFSLTEEQEFALAIEGRRSRTTVLG